MSLERIELLERQMAELDAQMRLRVEPFLPQSEPRDTMPGGEATAAHAILGEIGPDMSRFGAAARLASWARLSPGHNASAGQRRQGAHGSGASLLRGVSISWECVFIYWAPTVFAPRQDCSWPR